jgi:hypothetical protein
MPETVSILELAFRVGCTDATVRRRIRLGKVPPTHAIRPGVQGWRKEDIQETIENWKFSATGSRVRLAFGCQATETSAA